MPPATLASKVEKRKCHQEEEDKVESSTPVDTITVKTTTKWGEVITWAIITEAKEAVTTITITSIISNITTKGPILTIINIRACIKTIQVVLE